MCVYSIFQTLENERIKAQEAYIQHIEYAKSLSKNNKTPDNRKPTHTQKYSRPKKRKSRLPLGLRIKGYFIVAAIVYLLISILIPNNIESNTNAIAETPLTNTTKSTSSSNMNTKISSSSEDIIHNNSIPESSSIIAEHQEQTVINESSADSFTADPIEIVQDFLEAFQFPLFFLYKFFHIYNN